MPPIPGTPYLFRFHQYERLFAGHTTAASRHAGRNSTTWLWGLQDVGSTVFLLGSLVSMFFAWEWAWVGLGIVENVRFCTCGEYLGLGMGRLQALWVACGSCLGLWIPACAGMTGDHGGCPRHGTLAGCPCYGADVRLAMMPAGAWGADCLGCLRCPSLGLFSHGQDARATGAARGMAHGQDARGTGDVRGMGLGLFLIFLLFRSAGGLGPRDREGLWVHVGLYAWGWVGILSLDAGYWMPHLGLGILGFRLGAGSLYWGHIIRYGGGDCQGCFVLRIAWVESPAATGFISTGRMSVLCAGKMPVLRARDACGMGHGQDARGTCGRDARGTQGQDALATGGDTIPSRPDYSYKTGSCRQFRSLSRPYCSTRGRRCRRRTDSIPA